MSTTNTRNTGTSTSDHDLITTGRGFIDAFNAADWVAFASSLAANAVYDEVGTSRRIEGVAAVVACLQDWKQAMPDVEGTVDHAFSDGTTVLFELTWRGTHTGPLLGPSGAIPPTGKAQTTRSTWVLSFDGGKITESRHYFDMLSMMQQLGLLPR